MVSPPARVVQLLEELDVLTRSAAIVGLTSPSVKCTAWSSTPSATPSAAGSSVVALGLVLEKVGFARRHCW